MKGKSERKHRCALKALACEGKHKKTNAFRFFTEDRLHDYLRREAFRLYRPIGFIALVKVNGSRH